MNLNNYTIKSQEAIQQAQQLAQSYGHQQIENEHILKAIFEIGDRSRIPNGPVCTIHNCTVFTKLNCLRVHNAWNGALQQFYRIPTKGLADIHTL